MNILLKISNGPKIVDFQCVNVDPDINTVAELNEIIIKVFEEFRTTFQEA